MAREMSYRELVVEHEDNVTWITMNRPTRMNALTLSMWEELVNAFRAARDDPATRCIVWTGAGSRAFCVGRDLKEVDELKSTPLTQQDLEKMHADLIPLVVKMPKPTVAAINGVAAGVGLAFALACDIRIAVDTARFTVAFLKVGLVPDGGATYLLPRLIGYSKAFELGVTNRIIKADEAFRIGLANQVVSRATFRDSVAATARQLAALPPLAVSGTKELLLAGTAGTLVETLEREALVQAPLLHSTDYLEGVAAFLEHRQPKFVGR